MQLLPIKNNTRTANIVQWQTTYCMCSTRPWIQSPASEGKKKKKDQHELPQK
jgi:hypothetical protein